MPPRKDVIDAQAGPDVIDAEITGGRIGPRLVNRALGGSTTMRVRETALSDAVTPAPGLTPRCCAEPQLRLRHRDDPRLTGHGGGQPTAACSDVGRRSRVTGTTSPGSATPSTLSAGCARVSRPSAPPSTRWRDGASRTRPTAVRRASTASTRGGSPNSSTRTRLGRIEVSFPWSSAVRQRRRARVGHPVLPYADNKQGLCDHAGGGQPGPGGLRGRATSSVPTSSARPGTARRACRHDPEQANNIRVSAPAPTAGWSSTTPPARRR